MFASSHIHLGSQRILLAHSRLGILIEGPSITQVGDVVLVISHDEMTARCLDRMRDVWEAKHAADKVDDRVEWDYDAVPRRASPRAPHYYYYYYYQRSRDGTAKAHGTGRPVLKC